jgi:RNA polymerase primary sigma factor
MAVTTLARRSIVRGDRPRPAGRAARRGNLPLSIEIIQPKASSAKPAARKTAISTPISASSAIPDDRPARPAVRRQVEALLGENYAYMDSTIFRRRRIEHELFSFESGQEPALPLTSWYQPTRDDALDPAIVGAPQLMKADEERLMFLRFNYCKRRITRLLGMIKRQGITRDIADQFLHWHRRFEHFREYLVRTNLALVLAMAKRARLGDIDFAEVVSEGNMALLRAVDKFNVDRGFKFSTYACRAILKAFSRAAQKHTRHRTRFPVEFEPEMEKSDWNDQRRGRVEADCVDELKQIIDRNLADLSNVEQTVLRRRFNWEQTQETPLTLEEVGKIIGVTKERVRQIQNKAMSKIRQLMEEGVLRTRAQIEGAPIDGAAPAMPDPAAPSASQSAAAPLPDAAALVGPLSPTEPRI